jgi:hypothetical protein
MSTVVNLRDERQGRDRRALDAEVRDDGSLVIRGQDLGPGASSMSGDDEEYEWAYTFAAQDVPKLVAALGGTPDQPTIELLQQRYTGASSYELEHIVRTTEDTIPREFWNWG